MMSDNSTTLPWVTIPYIALEVFIGLCAMVGNILVIWVVKLNPSLRTTTFFFIISLALADIAVGVLVIPLAIVISLDIPMHFYSCLFMSCVLLIFTHASIMSLLAIAVDRYLRVKLTVRYRRVTTQRRIWLALGLCWLVSLLVGLTPMLGWNGKQTSRYPQNDTLLPCCFRSVMSMEYMVFFSFFTWIFIPLIIMCTIYMDIFYIIRNKLNQSFSGSKETSLYYGREFKTARSLFLVLFWFALCWLPLSFINCILYFNVEVPEYVMLLSILLSHANSMMNPIIYACKIRKFKETYLLILKTCRVCQSSDPTNPGTEQISGYWGLKTQPAAWAIQPAGYGYLELDGMLTFLPVSPGHPAPDSWADQSTCQLYKLFTYFEGPVMGLFILLSWALLSDAMVMDKKVKESFVLGTASASCNYDAHYKHHTKYWCRGYFRDYCHIIALTPNSTDRVALKDTGSQFIITVSCLTKEDTGWYWCGIQRDFARDDMDFTELIVTDSRGGQANEFWSGKDSPGNKNRSCRASRIIHKADRSRMSILIICVLLTSLGIIFIISHLSKRRRSQRNRRVGNSWKLLLYVLTPKEMAHTEQM
ncbi:adenosine receptor A3 [Ictidomys tridecemlineatus]